MVEARGQTASEVDLSIIVPTRNELEGIAPLLDRIADAVRIPCEVLFVDDSDDATGYQVRRVADRSHGTLEVRLLHRPRGRRQGGLGGAVCEGLRKARAPWVCVLDADLQHPPGLIPEMLAVGMQRGVDVVIASRYEDGASDEGLSDNRRLVSKACARAAHVTFPRRLSQVHDPLSGYFLLRRNRIDPDELHPHGFKILLEILGRYPELRTAEVGYHFQERYSGISKASLREGARFGRQLVSLRVAAVRNTPRATKHYCYDIHGIASVQSEVRLPELDKFRVRHLDRAPTISLVVRKFAFRRNGELIDLTGALPRVHYQEVLGRAGFVAEVELGETTEICISPLVARSTHVAYTNLVEPVLRWRLVERGYALVHGACLAERGNAFLITARTDTGKTTTMLRILDARDYAFLSDDLTLIDREGNVFSYPKPLTISKHTVDALDSAELDVLQRAFLPVQSRLHSRSGRRLAFAMASTGLPVATINAITQIVVPPPKYHVERLVPGVAFRHVGKLAGLFVIERSAYDEVRPLDADEALTTLLANCEDAFGFPPYDTLARHVHNLSEEDIVAHEREIIASAMQCVPATLVTSSSMGWADDIASVIDGALVADIAPDLVEAGR